MTDRSMTVQEAGRLGGRARKQDADYSAMGVKGGGTTKARYGHDYYVKLGKLAAEKRRRKRLLDDDEA